MSGRDYRCRNTAGMCIATTAIALLRDIDDITANRADAAMVSLNFKLG